MKKHKRVKTQWHDFDHATGLMRKTRLTKGSYEATKFKPTKSLADCNSILCKIVKLLRVLNRPHRSDYITSCYNNTYAENRTRGVIGKYLSRMTTWGYVQREPDPGDARSAVYWLTPEIEICDC